MAPVSTTCNFTPSNFNTNKKFNPLKVPFRNVINGIRRQSCEVLAKDNELKAFGSIALILISSVTNWPIQLLLKPMRRDCLA